MTIALFGTDGVRGEANVGVMAPDAVLRLAMASAQHFMPSSPALGDHGFSVVIGKDTRLSGYMIENALTAGLISMGAHVFLLGPVPTPAVALLTRSLRANLGIMISASHNPYTDNGVKLFKSDSLKISSHDERAIRNLYESNIFSRALPEKLGRAKRLDDAAGRYIEFAKYTFPKGMSLNGVRIVVDCAHGATYKLAPKVFWELGADVITVGCEPDGTNINRHCGATAPEMLQRKVIEMRADLGLALDGDGDRLILVDETGYVLDGDWILALIATSWASQEILRGEGIVGTHMSNLGLERYMESMGLNLYRSDVGDRSVVKLMEEKGCNVGGEQSGHVILNDYLTTGDGIIAALQVLAILKEERQKASYIRHLFAPVPQIIRNVRLKGGIDLSSVQSAIQDAEHHLGRESRLLVRTSGTEPVVRLMAQGDDRHKLNSVLDDLSHVIRSVVA